MTDAQLIEEMLARRGGPAQNSDSGAKWIESLNEFDELIRAAKAMFPPVAGLFKRDLDAPALWLSNDLQAKLRSLGRGAELDDVINLAAPQNRAMQATLRTACLLGRAYYDKDNPVCGISVMPIDADGTGLVLISLHPHEDRHQAEAWLTDLEAELSLYRTVIEATEDMVYDVDLETKNVIWTDKAFHSLGLLPRRITRKDIAALVHPEDLNRLQVATRRSITHGEPLNVQFRIRHADQSYRTWRRRGTVIKDKDGKPGRLVGVNTDLTDILANQEVQAQKSENLTRLTSARGKQVQLNALQHRFITAINHEFRTPLTVIQGHSNQLRRKIDILPADKIQEKLSAMEVAVDRIVSIIETIMLAVNLENGSIGCQPRSLCTEQMLRACVERARAAHPDHHFVLGGSISDSTVEWDLSLIEKLVLSLLDNAAHHSDPKQSIQLLCDDADNGCVVLSVVDSGAGIPIDEQSLIFEKFFRGAQSTKHPGSGVGLFIVRELADLHTGDVTFESIEGCGTTFTITLPRKVERRLALDANDDVAQPQPA